MPWWRTCVPPHRTSIGFKSPSGKSPATRRKDAETISGRIGSYVLDYLLKLSTERTSWHRKKLAGALKTQEISSHARLKHIIQFNSTILFSFRDNYFSLHPIHTARLMILCYFYHSAFQIVHDNLRLTVLLSAEVGATVGRAFDLPVHLAVELDETSAATRCHEEN